MKSARAKTSQKGERSSINFRCSTSSSNSVNDHVRGDASRVARPSDRLNPKTIDPFKAERKPKSAFEAVYASGGIPCRLIHGSVKHKLQWSTDPTNLAFDPLLITLAEGLKEYKHPYQFVAQQGFKELLEVDDAFEKAVPLLARLIPPIKIALGSSTPSVSEGAVSALVQLSQAVGPTLCPHHLKSVLSHLSKLMMNKKYKEMVSQALNQIEVACGKESIPVIKSKIPTYSSVT